jgi:hypothetical protein
MSENILLPLAQPVPILGTTMFARAAVCRFLEIHKAMHFSVAAALLLAHSLAQADGWHPSPTHVQVPIWPGAVPDALPDPKPESVDSGGGANDVSRPTMTVYAAKGRNTEAAVVVFPGGGYRMLAMSGEGTRSATG